jgi:hypothetical protein
VPSLYTWTILFSTLGKKLTEEELNSLIAHAHQQIEQLQHQLAEQQALGQKHLDDAIEKQRKEDEHLTNQVLEVELQKQKSQFEIQKQIWVRKIVISGMNISGLKITMSCT